MMTWRWTTKHWRATLTAALLTLALIVTGCVKNPVSGAEEFSLMSEDQELAKGAELYPKYTQQFNGLPADDPGLQAYVRRVGGWLAKNSHRPELPWEFNVVNSSQINAYAIPGGKVSITRGLITRMNSEDELAFVLGHEIGHVAARHSAAQYTRGVLVTAAVLGVAIAVSDSDYRELGVMAANVGGVLLLASYSRDQEREADALGMEYMARAGYNPKAAVDVLNLFQSLQKREPSAVETLLASHPLSAERIENAGDDLKIKLGWATARAYNTRDFNQALARQKARKPAYAAMDKADDDYQAKRYDRAAQNYRQASAMLPQEGLFKARLARVELDLRQFGPALEHARQGATLRPDLYETNHVLGAAYLVNNQFGPALAATKNAETFLANNDNRFLIGLCYEKLGERDKAKAIYQAVRQLDPKGQAGDYAAKRLRALR
ncbi:M48 family metallopeptidase [Desulfarculus baarsii]|nr:M48 family metallopeptidase [Desulfarculus baarsii]